MSLVAALLEGHVQLSFQLRSKRPYSDRGLLFRMKAVDLSLSVDCGLKHFSGCFVLTDMTDPVRIATNTILLWSYWWQW